MEKIDYEGVNPKAVALIKMIPNINSIKLTRVGADVTAFLGSGAVYTKKLKLHAAGRRIKARLYCPKDAVAKDCLVYFHGGGFMYGGLGTADGGLKDYCAATKQAVVSIAYSLAPEHPYPNAVNECFEAARQIYRQMDKMGFQRMYMGGDSAGGNLACVTAARMREDGCTVSGLFLLYPFVELVSEGIEEKYPSMKQFGEGYFLQFKDLHFMTKNYVPENYDVDAPTLSPINGDLSAYPPTIVFVCGFDPLRDMGVAFHEKLKSAGVKTELVRYDDMIHGYFSMFKEYAEDSVRRIADFFDAERNARGKGVTIGEKKEESEAFADALK